MIRKIRVRSQSAVNHLIKERIRAKRKSRERINNWACVTSPSPGNQVDGLPGGVSTGAVVASWHPRRRATINIFDMKNKGLDENC